MFRVLLLLLLLWGQESVWSVRLVELRVPAYVAEGGEALLGCQYDLEGDTLYSVKWYKGRDEFYRYVPKNPSPIMDFKRPGINVDLSKSSNTSVLLENMSVESEGDYSCEVSGEAPSFTTVNSTKHIYVHLLPETGPHVTGLKNQFALGEEAIINCTSAGSRPAAHIQWLVNDKPALQDDLQGPWRRMSNRGLDAEDTTLQLRFIVEPRHFVGSTMSLRCQATITPLYQRETNSSHYVALPFTLITERTHFPYIISTDDAADASARVSIANRFLFSLSPLILLLVF